MEKWIWAHKIKKVGQGDLVLGCKEQLHRGILRHEDNFLGRADTTCASGQQFIVIRLLIKMATQAIAIHYWIYLYMAMQYLMHIWYTIFVSNVYSSDMSVFNHQCIIVLPHAYVAKVVSLYHIMTWKCTKPQCKLKRILCTSTEV